MLDESWLLTLFTLLLVTALTWSSGALNISFGGVAGGLAALAAISLVFAAAADHDPGRVWLRHTLITAHLFGVLVVGYVWQQAGGMQNPLFLLAFVLPVFGSSFLSRVQPYLTALLSIGVVGMVAVWELPDLRWYLAGFGSVVASLLAPLDGAQSAGNAPFPSFYAPVGYFVALYVMFSLLLLACAVAAEGLAELYRKLAAQAGAAQAEVAHAWARWLELVRSLPAAAVLVEADTLKIVVANVQFAALIGASTPTDDEFAGECLLDKICLSYPEMIEELVGGENCVPRPCPFRVAEHWRLAEIRVQPLMLDGRRQALIMLADITGSFCVNAALDASDNATLVIDSQARISTMNQPAYGLFAGTAPGAQILQQLNVIGSKPRWWEPGLGGRRKSLVEISRRTYQVTSSAVELPGAADPLIVLAFRPVASAHAPSRPKGNSELEAPGSVAATATAA